MGALLLFGNDPGLAGYSACTDDLNSWEKLEGGCTLPGYGEGKEATGHAVIRCHRGDRGKVG
jgi:hypothetical protein